MITGTKEYLDGIAKEYKCPDHDAALVVAWHAGENSYVLRCGAGHFPETVTRQPSLTQLYRQDQLPEGPIKDNIERRERKKAMTQGKQSTAVTLGGVPATDLGTGELLPLEMVQALVKYAYLYELDPKRGHVCLMYGKPYITIDGYLYHAFKYGIKYTLDSRPLKPDELKEYQAPENAHVWLSRVKVLGTGQEFVGYGVVTQEEMTEESKKKLGQLRSPVVAAHPWQLAQKRAEWQALRRAFPIGETGKESNEA